MEKKKVLAICWLRQTRTESTSTRVDTRRCSKGGPEKSGVCEKTSEAGEGGRGEKRAGGYSYYGKKVGNCY